MCPSVYVCSCQNRSEIGHSRIAGIRLVNPGEILRDTGVKEERRRGWTDVIRILPYL